MIGQFTIIVRPIEDVAKVLGVLRLAGYQHRAGFDYCKGVSTTVVGVTVKSFVDIPSILTVLDDLAYSRVRIVDARGRLYEYIPQHSTITSHGRLYETYEGDVAQASLTFAGVTYSYNPEGI